MSMVTPLLGSRAHCENVDGNFLDDHLHVCFGRHLHIHVLYD